LVWVNSSWTAVSDRPEEVDIAPGIAAVLGPKDASEIQCTKSASQLNSTIMQYYFIDKMANTIEADKKLTHDKASKLFLLLLFGEVARQGGREDRSGS
jgi:nucleosome binding factor SPN SPT16 subunit